MTATLRLTDAGRNAMLDAANAGTRAVRVTRLALGAGSGPGGDADDGRVALRDERDVSDVDGSAAAAGQIAVRAAFETSSAYAVTEIGLKARIGNTAEFLFAYWSNDGEVFVNKPSDLRFLVVAVIAIRRAAAALYVNVAPDLTVGTVAAFVDLTDAPPSYVSRAGAKVAVKADGTGVEFVFGLSTHEAATIGETRAGALNTKAVTPVGLAAAVGDLRNGVAAARNTLKGLSDAVDAVQARIRTNADINALADLRIGAAGVPVPLFTTTGNGLVVALHPGVGVNLSRSSADFRFLKAAWTRGASGDVVYEEDAVLRSGIPSIGFNANVAFRNRQNGRVILPRIDSPMLLTLSKQTADTIRLFGIWGIV